MHTSNNSKLLDTILFVIPPHITFKDFIAPGNMHKQIIKADGHVYGNLITDMPLGPLALSAYIKKASLVKTMLLDFNVELNAAASFDFESYYAYFYYYFAKYIESSPGIIAISSLFSPSYSATKDIARAAKEVFKDTLVLCGGNLATNMYLKIFDESDYIDAICYGEGEKPLLALIQADDREILLETHGSWITPNKAKNPLFIPNHDFVEDLDEIPEYDYLICEDKYFANPAFTTYGNIQEKGAGFHVLTSRGCPFKCTFCASHKVHGRQMRYYSLERVKNELRKLKETYGAKTFIFQDDHLMGDKKRALEIIRFVGEIGVKAIFQNSLALYALDREMLEALKHAGMEQLVLSVESGSDRVLRHVMRKPLKLSIVRKVTEDCRELGIYTYANILIGLPGETKQDIEDSLQFLKTIYANWFGVFCANPLVGSEIFDICLENGFLKEDWMESDYKKAVIETGDWNAEYIQEMAYIFNLVLNFKENSDLRLGDPVTALTGFERAIRAKSDHAIAYHYAAECYRQLGNYDEEERYRQLASNYAKLPFWQHYIDRLCIPISRQDG